jgi:hypothetical protein
MESTHTDQRPVVPPVLYVPRDSADRSDGPVSLDYRTTTDGRTALLAYTALDRLVACCGDAQPWIVIETSKLDDIGKQQPYDLILLDLEIPTEHRRTGVTA